ncbi:MAG: capsule assembly Wzi family protein [Kangiellaceae bacterium]|nr:capsule assembly Wzi family protein [Kangiellaceae bacterium]
MQKVFVSLALLLTSFTVLAEPWIDTRDPWLRADIEALANHGVIKVPITTWPLMWAPIVRDLEEVDNQLLSNKVMPIYMRVKRRARFETKHESNSFLILKAGNQGKILRHYGDDRREKAEITTKNTGVSKNFAWNIEATRAFDPIDGEENRLDHSYIAAVWGNWILSAGAQERWYGSGWDTSLILSNNARPVPALSIQRNYSDAFESPWLSWIGPWTFNAFIGQLESDRHVPHAKLLGMSVNFKPFNSLEIGLRRTAQWGGEGRPQNLSNFFNLLIGRDNCDELEGGCGADRSNEPGNQLAGIDFKWRIPTKKYYGSLYGQLIGEDEAGYLPSRKIYQFGYSTDFQLGDLDISSYIEYADTENEYRTNLTYNNAIYRTGYRTELRSLGSTFDNDSQSVGLGLIATHKNGDKYKLKLTNVNMNSDGVGEEHSISTTNIKFNQIEFHYLNTTKYGLIGAQIEVKDKTIDTFGYQKEKYNISLSWKIKL